MKIEDYSALLHQETTQKISQEFMLYLEENSYKERIFYLIWGRYDFDKLDQVKHWNTAKNIAEVIGIEQPNIKDYRAISSALRFIYHNDSSMFRTSGSRRLIRMPPLKIAIKR